MFPFYRKHIKYLNYREFCSIEDAKEWGQLHFGDWLPQYGQESLLDNDFDCDDDFHHRDVDILEMYLGHYHAAINNELRDYYYLQHMDMGEDAKRIRRLNAQKICNLISQRKIEDNIVLYRFIDSMETFRSMLVKEHGRPTVGSIMIDKGFMSTSLVYETLKKEQDGDVLLRLLCPKGFKGAYVDFISRRPNEQEVLLPPNCEFVINKKYRNKDKKIVFDCFLKMPD